VRAPVVETVALTAHQLAPLQSAHYFSDFGSKAKFNHSHVWHHPDAHFHTGNSRFQSERKDELTSGEEGLEIYLIQNSRILGETSYPAGEKFPRTSFPHSARHRVTGTSEHNAPKGSQLKKPRARPAQKIERLDDPSLLRELVQK
jgi:hypothetical protein